MEEEQRRTNKMKTYAIEVFFDKEFDFYVRNLWSKCDQSEISFFMNRIEGVEPHIALSLYEDIDSNKLITMFEEFIRTDLKSFDLFIDSVSVFPVTMVTYLQPNAKQEFINLMNTIHNYFVDFENNCNPYYKPDRWFPHVTIAKNVTIDELKKAQNFVVDNFVPQRIKVQRLGLVEINYLDHKCVSCRTITYKELN
jgi:2'-5' RNA ligase